MPPITTRPESALRRPGDDRHERRLAGAVAAEQGRDLAAATSRFTASSARRDP